MGRVTLPILVNQSVGAAAATDTNTLMYDLYGQSFIRFVLHCKLVSTLAPTVGSRIEVNYAFSNDVIPVNDAPLYLQHEKQKFTLAVNQGANTTRYYVSSPIVYTTRYLYLWFSNTALGNTVSLSIDLVGTDYLAKGDTGDTGYSGISGYSGTAGSVEFSGYSGYSGFSGLNGSGIGIPGTSGFSGYSGYSGATGSNGASGFSGLTGSNGLSGYSGYSGLNGSGIGIPGDSGFSGYSGLTGSNGTSGYSGLNGEQGLSGYSGLTGATGTSGYSGVSGFSGAVNPLFTQIDLDTNTPYTMTLGVNQSFYATDTYNSYSITAAYAVTPPAAVTGTLASYHSFHNNSTQATTITISGVVSKVFTLATNESKIIVFNNPHDTTAAGNEEILRELVEINHTHVVANISDFPTTWDYSNLDNIPSEFTPSAHNHDVSEVYSNGNSISSVLSYNTGNFTWGIDNIAIANINAISGTALGLYNVGTFPASTSSILDYDSTRLTPWYIENTTSFIESLGLHNGNYSGSLIANLVISKSYNYIDRTTNLTLNFSESGNTYTNTGTTAKVQFTLPAATAGHWYEFIVTDADGIRVIPAVGDNIRIAGNLGATGTGTDGYIDSTVIGSVIKLVAVDGTTWMAVHSLGTWTLDI